MGTSRFSCWLIGGDSLVAECGDILLRGGHDVYGVATSTPRIAEWARSRSLRTIDAGADQLYDGLARRPFDHLFAVTHLAVLPEPILALPARGAINFHDGPLPDYAGLNAPAWALMHGETRFGITWHRLTSRIDAGDILKQRFFDVAPDETSFSLNAKCFSAAIDSFAALVDELAAGAVQSKPQDPRRRRYFGRHQRPPAAGVIDWTRSAVEIQSLVRALDFGRYSNRLGVPKLFHRGRALVLRRAEVRDTNQPGVPGTVLSIDEGAIVIATGQGSIAAVELADLAGNRVPALEAAARLELAPDVILESLARERANALTELDQRMSQHEPHWVERLAALDPITLPIAFGHAVRSAKSLDVPIPARLGAVCAGERFSTLIAAAACAYLARIASRPTFDIGVSHPAIDQYSDLATWVASCVPMRVSVDPAQAIDSLARRMTAGLAELYERSPWLRDVITRYSSEHGLKSADEGEILPVVLRFHDSFDAPAAAEVGEWTFEISDASSACRCVFDPGRIELEQAESIVRGFATFLESLATNPERPVAEHATVDDASRRRQIDEWNRTRLPYRGDLCVHDAFEEQVRRTPEAIALVCDGQSLTYAELDARSNILAAELSRLSVGAGQLVGVCVERSVELVVAVMGVLKSGAAYVPLDPQFPSERLAFMAEDASLQVIVANDHLAARLPANGATLVRIDEDWARIAARHDAVERHGVETARARASDVAYVLYTSGSTGKPKGVLVEHRNVANFFAAMDERIPHDPPGVWLAVTSLSFDISVLELFWTLARGFKVVLHTGRERSWTRAAAPARDVEFSLFYFSSDEGSDRSEGYRLLLEGARFADAHGFRAIWTPERHFHAFGGLYPNPAVTAAAIAAITQNVAIRAGSVVLPLHHPIRVAEEWALVDNLSNGRAGISFASGWQPNDFVLAPGNRTNAKEVMFRDIEIVRRLWRGETVAFPGADGAAVEIRTLPRPVQRELPCWVTTAGNVETFAAAGRIGANVLTHLLGQTVEQLVPKIAAYREARAEAGFDPSSGIATLMLHTFVGDDEDTVREAVRRPLDRYLASSLSLMKHHAAEFPTFRRNGNDGADFAHMDPDEQAALLEHARERYYTTQGLFGSPDRCSAMVERVSSAGVDEIACLIDFGVPTEDVLASLPVLERVQRSARSRVGSIASNEYSIPALIRREGVTHLQCTPSMAHMLCADPETRQALHDVKHVFVGGEALPSDLAATLSSSVGESVTNMYGPTETTIWSSTYMVDGASASPSIPIGRPIANTSFYVLDESLAPVPIGVAGELYIGGDGVARGYLERPELNAQRFVTDPFASGPGARMYRTGDLVRYRADGIVDFLGRTDHQIKVRGHRIEPGEIEALLAQESWVAQSLVVAREDTAGDQRLVAYVVSKGAAPNAASLRERLRAQLPDYMVPAHFVFLDAIPRTPNGKTDRRALPKPKDESAAPTANTVLPTNELEACLARLWQETLGVDRVGVDDNFFDLGGQSLLIVRMYRRMGELTSRTLSLTDLFRFPTIRSLARFLSTDEPARAVEDGTSRGRQRRSLGRRRLRAGET